MAGAMIMDYCEYEWTSPMNVVKKGRIVSEENAKNLLEEFLF